MLRNCAIGAQVWAAGMGQVNIPMLPIPNETSSDTYKTQRIYGKVRMTITCGAGGGCTSREIMDWISNVQIKAMDHIFWIGSMRDNLMLQLYEEGLHHVHIPAACNANDNAVVRYFSFVLNFHHPAAFQPQDFGVPAGAFDDGSIQLTFGAAALNANTTVNSCTVDFWASLERSNDVQAAPLVECGSVDGQLNGYRFASGVYASLFLRDPPAANFAAGDVTLVGVTANGEQIQMNLLPDGVLRSYALDNHCAVPNIAAGADGLDLWPDDAADAYFLPLLWLTKDPNLNKITRMIDTKGSDLLVDLRGALATTPHYIYRRYRPQSTSTAFKQLQKAGIGDPSAVDIKPKTASKSQAPTNAPDRPGVGALPVKVTQAPTVAAAGKLVGKIAIKR